MGRQQLADQRFGRERLAHKEFAMAVAADHQMTTAGLQLLLQADDGPAKGGIQQCWIGTMARQAELLQ